MSTVAFTIDTKVGMERSAGSAEITLSAPASGRITVGDLILQKVPNVPGLSANEKNQILGEAHFLRALHYHNLVKLWGDIPMPLEPLDSPAEAAKLTRTPKAQVYTQILADLTQAEQLMTTAKQARQAR